MELTGYVFAYLHKRCTVEVRFKFWAQDTETMQKDVKKYIEWNLIDFIPSCKTDCDNSETLQGRINSTLKFQQRILPTFKVTK
jgi:hypothetical protein